jgi:hypothetical protein
MSDPLFIGVYPTGIAYADRTREVDNDYARLAFLPFKSLEIEWRGTCPLELHARITAHAAAMQARRGEEFEVSTCGQTVKLGS